MRSLLFGHFCFCEAISCINWNKAVLKKKKVIVITKQKCERDKQKNKQSRINEAPFHSCSFFFFFKYYRRHFGAARAARCNWHKNNHHNEKKKEAEKRNSTTISLHLYLIRRKKNKKKKERFRYFLCMNKKGKTPMRQISTHLCLATYKRTHRWRCKSKKKKDCAHVFRVT